MKNLISLKEFNKNRYKDYWECENAKFIPNGIACPKCGQELVDTNTNRRAYQIASNPPQYDIHCKNKDCNYYGYRLA